MNISPPSVVANNAVLQGAEDAAFYRGVLHELIEIGVDLARQVRAEAQAETGVVEAVQAFDRLTRAIRRTIGLARRLGDPVRDDASRRVAARRRIIRDVEDAIQRKPSGESDRENLRDELLERLDGPDVEDDIDHRPVAEIIADICRDLGLAAPPGVQPWQRRTPADIAVLCARAAKGGALHSPDDDSPGTARPMDPSRRPID